MSVCDVQMDAGCVFQEKNAEIQTGKGKCLSKSAEKSLDFLGNFDYNGTVANISIYVSEKRW